METNDVGIMKMYALFYPKITVSEKLQKYIVGVTFEYNILLVYFALIARETFCLNPTIYPNTFLKYHEKEYLKRASKLGIKRLGFYKCFQINARVFMVTRNCYAAPSARYLILVKVSLIFEVI